MHVLFLSDNFPPETNAPATRLHEHARRWVAAGHRVTVVTCAPNFPAGRVFDGYENRWFAREEIDGIQVLRVKTFISANEGFLLRTLDYVSFMLMGFLGGLFVRRPDVVVATSPQFFCAIGGWLLAAVRRKPFVFEVRDLWPASIAAVGALKPGRLLNALERLELFLYRRAHAVVPVTRAFRRDLVARGVAPEKLHVVTNGVDLERYAPRARCAETARDLDLGAETVIGYLGTHGMAHALENVLAAAERTRHRRDLRWLFVGDGAAKARLVERAAELGLENVSFHAPQPKERMPALWSVCDVVLVHLKDDPVFETVIPSKIFEAMGMGRPVLYAGPDGEAAEILREARAGLCVAAEAPDALAAAALRLADDGALRAELARASHAAAERYSRAHLAAELLEVLQATAEQRRPAPAAAPAEASARVARRAA